MTIQEAVKEIISKRGLEIFKQSKMFFASIDDLAPEHRKERIILRRNVDDSILNLFIDDTLPVNTRLVRIKNHLEDYGLTDDSITFIIETFGIPLGYEKTIEDLKTKNVIVERIYAPASQINNTPQKIEEITLNDDALKLLGYVNKNTITKLNILGTFSTPSGMAYKITAIENSIFANCTSLTHVVIPNTVKIINQNAFKGCTSLKQITIPDSVQFIRASAFENCSSLTVITIPKGVTEICLKTFCGCKSLAIVNIPDTVKKIGESAFEDCALLSKVTIPNGVTKIEKETFCGCKSLVSINIPDSVTDIDSMAFFECESLNDLVIPEKVANLGLNSFSGCKKLTKITAPVKFFKDEYIEEISREEIRRRAETEAKRKAEEERRKAEAEAKRKAEEERRKKEARVLNSRSNKDWLGNIYSYYGLKDSKQ